MAWMSSCRASVIVLFLLRLALQARCLLELAQPILQQADALEAGHQTAPGTRFFERNAARVYAGALDRAADHRVAGDVHVVGDADVSGEPDMAADDAVPADSGAAGNAGAGSDRGVRADAHVVRDHDQVVEFHASSSTVSPRAPRSMVVFAPISTSAPTRTAPTWGTFSHVPRTGAKPKPSPPIT